jgi:hypothetical protein
MFIATNVVAISEPKKLNNKYLLYSNNKIDGILVLF